MLVKGNDRELSFLFQAADPYFEIGYKILEQERIAEMLPYRRVQHEGREKLVFSIKKDVVVPLSEALPHFLESDIVDLLYTLCALTGRIEENGFLKKECIWYQYEHIFFDIEARRPMVVILPITGDFRYADGLGWWERFQNTITRITAFLTQEKAAAVGRLMPLFAGGVLDCDTLLEELNVLGVPSVKHRKRQPNRELLLCYSGSRGTLELQMEEDCVIGQDAGVADQVVPREISTAVSRRHCTITRLNGKFFVQDMGSTNHTLVNGVMIPAFEIMELVHNDILSVADIEFRVHIVEK